MHEYGHTKDSRIYGFTYLFAIGLPSLNSAGGKGDHSVFWTEKRANVNAKGYFEKYYGVNWNSLSPYGGGELRWDDKGKPYWHYYTIEDEYPTK